MWKIIWDEEEFKAIVQQGAIEITISDTEFLQDRKFLMYLAGTIQLGLNNLKC